MCSSVAILVKTKKESMKKERKKNNLTVGTERKISVIKSLFAIIT